MLAGLVCSAIIGIALGAFGAFLFFSFDNAWKRGAEFLAGTGVTGGLIYKTHEYLGINTSGERAWTISAMLACLLISFIICSYILCQLIKDKDDSNILRMRDILLGQKEYIKEYYRIRQKQIDEDLNITELERKEKSLKQREDAVLEKEASIKEQHENLRKKVNRGLHLELPDNNAVVLKQDLVNKMPSYVEEFTHFTHNLQNQNIMMLSGTDREKITSFCLEICQLTVRYLFGNSGSVRAHFRYYDPSTRLYEGLIAVTGEGICKDELTAIPFENSMIEKSYKCQKSIIKSINVESDYHSNNHEIWQDYMTYCLHNIKYNGIPCLSFGISVKNASRYRDTFYYLNYVRVEQYINQAFDVLREKIDIINTLYGEESDSVNR